MYRNVFEYIIIENLVLFDFMKKEIRERSLYESPTVRFFDMETEGIICQSVEATGHEEFEEENFDDL